MNRIIVFFTLGVGVLNTTLTAHIGTKLGSSSLTNRYLSIIFNKLDQVNDANTLQQFISHKLFRLLISEVS